MNIQTVITSHNHSYTIYMKIYTVQNKFTLEYYVSLFLLMENLLNLFKLCLLSNLLIKAYIPLIR